MKIDKDDAIALIVTIIIHLIALYLLSIWMLRTLMPIDDGGIPILFGDYIASTGYVPPPTATPPQRESPAQTTIRPAPKPKEPIIPQVKEETVWVGDTIKKKDNAAAEEKARREREEAERKRREEDERRKREEELRKQQEAIEKRASNAFGAGSSQNNSRGDVASGTTNQGNPFGNSDTGAKEAAGGFGSFNLSGRSIGAGGLPRPDFLGQQDGKIVIKIAVDPNGNVLQAEIELRGTNINDLSMRNSALNAARRAKFSKSQRVDNQFGTITYNYTYLIRN